jgi:hypothetical protein|tara:strand:+ start:357 stop:623 length:267 start_codon:yes stop_codon:yes gene_type:complete
MLNNIKNKIMAFKDIFKDDNTINEKNIVGFASFVIMTIFAAADIITGLMGKELLITDTIFNSFVIITLGSFGIDGLTKIFTKDKKINE